jgi:DNA-binding XRE family transcriptional regulator
VPMKPRPSPPGLEILRAGTGELVLRINGRHVPGNQTMLAVLARLFDNLGTVIPYEQLCQLIGHKSANSAATHVLRQYTAWLRGVLIANKAPYVITVARDVGYGLCKMGGEPRLTATSRNVPLPELGRNLRRVRTAAGLTQTALAKRLGMDRSYVSGLEAGQRNPTAVTLQRLAKVLKVTPVVFFQ